MFKILDTENHIHLAENFNSKSEAKRYIETNELDAKKFTIVATELVEPTGEASEDEVKVDAEVSKRTSTYDQDLKERARNVGINPDNFEEEHLLGEAVTKAEAEVTAETEQA